MIGARHVVAASATGEFAGHDGKVAFREAAAWAYLTPERGWRAHVLDENVTVTFDGVAWRGPAEGALRVAGLGVGADSDGANPLVVAGPATLLTHQGAGHQLKINKAAATDTASLLFQTGWSGRAEIGAAWVTGISIDLASEWLTAPTGTHVAFGSATLPGIGFDGDPDTGIFRPGANTLAWATGGSERLRLTAADLLTGGAITQSATDATTGRLLKTGDFGLGLTGSGPTVLTNLDDFSLPSGFYIKMTAEIPGILPPGVPTNVGLYVEIHRYSKNSVWQTLWRNSGGNNGVWRRLITGNTPQAWRQIAPADLVSVASQSGGVPTGAVIERGANANGEYVRWADGTQICYGPIAVAVASAASQMFVLPAAFVSGTIMPAAISLSHLTSTRNAALRLGNIQGVTAAGSSLMLRLVAAGTSTDPAANTEKLFYSAIGRWF